MKGIAKVYRKERSMSPAERIMGNFARRKMALNVCIEPNTQESIRKVERALEKRKIVEKQLHISIPSSIHTKTGSRRTGQLRTTPSPFSGLGGHHQQHTNESSLGSRNQYYITGASGEDAERDLVCTGVNESDIDPNSYSCKYKHRYRNTSPENKEGKESGYLEKQNVNNINNINNTNNMNINVKSYSPEYMRKYPKTSTNSNMEGYKVKNSPYTGIRGKRETNKKGNSLNIGSANASPITSPKMGEKCGERNLRVNREKISSSQPPSHIDISRSSEVVEKVIESPTGGNKTVIYTKLGKEAIIGTPPGSEGVKWSLILRLNKDGKPLLTPEERVINDETKLISSKRSVDNSPSDNNNKQTEYWEGSRNLSIVGQHSSANNQSISPYTSPMKHMDAGEGREDAGVGMEDQIDNASTPRDEQLRMGVEITDQMVVLKAITTKHKRASSLRDQLRKVFKPHKPITKESFILGCYTKKGRPFLTGPPDTTAIRSYGMQQEIEKIEREKYYVERVEKNKERYLKMVNERIGEIDINAPPRTPAGAGRNYSVYPRFALKAPYEKAIEYIERVPTEDRGGSGSGSHPYTHPHNNRNRPPKPMSSHPRGGNSSFKQRSGRTTTFFNRRSTGYNSPTAPYATVMETEGRRFDNLLQKPIHKRTELSLHNYQWINDFRSRMDNHNHKPHTAIQDSNSLNYTHLNGASTYYPGGCLSGSLGVGKLGCNYSGSEGRKNIGGNSKTPGNTIWRYGGGGGRDSKYRKGYPFIRTNMHTRTVSTSLGHTQPHSGITTPIICTATPPISATNKPPIVAVKGDQIGIFDARLEEAQGRDVSQGTSREEAQGRNGEETQGRNGEETQGRNGEETQGRNGEEYKNRDPYIYKQDDVWASLPPKGKKKSADMQNHRKANTNCTHSPVRERELDIYNKQLSTNRSTTPMTLEIDKMEKRNQEIMSIMNRMDLVKQKLNKKEGKCKKNEFKERYCEMESEFRKPMALDIGTKFTMAKSKVDKMRVDVELKERDFDAFHGVINGIFRKGHSAYNSAYNTRYNSGQHTHYSTTVGHNRTFSIS